MILTNEKKYFEQIMESHIVPIEVSCKRLLLYIAKYYYDPVLTLRDYKNLVLKKMAEFDLSPCWYQEYMYEKYIEKICSKLLDGELSHEFKSIQSVNLYQSEYNTIQSASTDKERKILFTLYILAKINNANGWINYELKDIFKMANVTASERDRLHLMYKLYKSDLIDQNHRNDSLGYKVTLGTTDESIVLVVSDFTNLGNQYIANFKDGWGMCAECSKLFKKKTKTGRTRMYCKACAIDIDREKAKERMQKYRETEKCSKNSP